MLDTEFLLILQTFTYALNMPDKQRANKYYTETDIEELKREVNLHREKISEKQFFYIAGRTTENMLNEANDSDIETFNRMCGAINIFTKFIELEK